VSRTIRLGISTCPNDTFAFHGLLTRAVDWRGLQFEVELLDIEQLNERLLGDGVDVGRLEGEEHGTGHGRAVQHSGAGAGDAGEHGVGEGPPQILLTRRMDTAGEDDVEGVVGHVETSGKADDVAPVLGTDSGTRGSGDLVAGVSRSAHRRGEPGVEVGRAAREALEGSGGIGRAGGGREGVGERGRWPAAVVGGRSGIEGGTHETTGARTFANFCT
jgi:hypothetical protein